LLEVQDCWQQDRAAALAEMEQDAAELERRQRRLSEAEQALASVRAELHQKHEALARLRAALEAWQARLAGQEAGWQAQRELLLSDLEARERRLQRRQEQLDEVQRRRNQRRQAEVAELAGARERCEEARRQYSALWQDCERLRQDLLRQEQALAGRALALDRLRQELVHQAPDSARAESRLARLERRESSRLESEMRHLEAQRDVLTAERQRLDELAGQLRQQADDLAERLRQAQQQQADWEQQQAVACGEEEQRREELRRLHAQHALDERQLRQLRDQLEGVARVLIEEGGLADPPAQQAA
jgi:chromosome segregation ATPase